MFKVREQESSGKSAELPWLAKMTDSTFVLCYSCNPPGIISLVHRIHQTTH